MLFPPAEAIAGLDPAGLPMPRSRSRTLVGIAAELAAGRLVLGEDADRARDAALLALPGIGPWTAGYIAMRALHDPDAFIPGDAGLRHGLASLGCDPGLREAERVAESWRPYRAYAIQHVWAVAAGITTLYARMPSPIGDLLLAGDGEELQAVWIDGQRWAPEIGDDWRESEVSRSAWRGSSSRSTSPDSGRRLTSRCVLGAGPRFRTRCGAPSPKSRSAETRTYGAIAADLGRPARGPRGGRRQRPEPAVHHHPLPPPDRLRRRTGGLRGRP